MREIKFRGKTVRKGDWVYGYYVYDEEWAKSYIYYECKPNLVKGQMYHHLGYVEVDPKTVGQFIGKRDMEGTLIYEGDIVEFLHTAPSISEDLNDFKKSIDLIVFRNGAFKTNKWGYDIANLSNNNEIKIIGNIHDNPELLEETK